MQLESVALQVIAERIEAGMDAALDEVVKDAKRRANRSARTGAWRDSMTRTDIEENGTVYTSHVGSPLVSAITHEKGAYIRAKRSPWLYIPQPDGTLRKVKAVRVPASPAITPAAKTFGRRFSAQMRLARLRSRKFTPRTVR